MNLRMSQLTALYQVYLKIKDLSFPIKTSYSLAKLGQALEKEIPFYDSEISKIINTYGERDENGNLVQIENGNIKIQSEKIDECAKKINELGELQVEIECGKIPLESLGDIELSVQELNALLPIIEV